MCVPLPSTPRSSPTHRYSGPRAALSWVCCRGFGRVGCGGGGGRAEVAATEARSPRHPVVRAGALGPQHGVHHLRLTRVAARWAVRSRRFPSEAPVQSKKKEVAQEVASPSASPKTTRKQLPDDVGRSLLGGRLLARGAPLPPGCGRCAPSERIVVMRQPEMLSERRS